MKRLVEIVISAFLCLSFVVSSCVAFATDTADISQAPLALSNDDEKYDVNGDGKVTVADAEFVLKVAAGQKANNGKCDVNGDGVVSTDDVTVVLKVINGTLGDDEYVAHLLDLGFTKSYAEDLLALHKKYPNWEFVPFKTGLDWATAVKGEHTPHKKQLIENNVSANFMCTCSDCKGVIQEGSNWVSASQEAVEYYLDPRNFLIEEYIFQFETTAYNSTHTISAVETILKPTWMYDSYIKYFNTSGEEVTHKKDGKAVKYSEAIMRAAAESGMSAYYLASKIVQEVGSSKASYAAGSSGTSEPYNGIFNYYNIGAYTGAGDGLRWANGYMKAKAKVAMYKSASTTADKVKTVPQNTELNYITKSGDFYKVKAKVDGRYYTGYIHKDSVSISTSYGRPWTNPYKSIYYGAQYIYESFSDTQFTGYLQKFNVNPESDYLYSHEYMANVRAAAAESKKTYNAYKENGILSDAMVFYIPVFKNMPNANLTSDEEFKLVVPDLSGVATRTTVTLSWSSIDNSKYRIYKYNEETGKYEKVKNVTTTSYTETGLEPGQTVKYKMRGYRSVDGSNIYTKYSSVVTLTTKEAVVEKTGTVSVSDLLNLRKEPNTSCTVLTTLKNGTKVTILETSGSWHKVKCTVDKKEYTGYAHTDYIKNIALTFGGESFSEPTSTLKQGNTGNGVMWLQIHLAYLKYLTNDDVTGTFDDKTLSAVKKFQTDKKLDVDGLVGSATRTALKSAV